MYDVIAIGELLIDFTLDRVQDDGYPVMAAHPGGSVANFLAPLAKYGRKTANGSFPLPASPAPIRCSPSTTSTCPYSTRPASFTLAPFA